MGLRLERQAIFTDSTTATRRRKVASVTPPASTDHTPTKATTGWGKVTKDGAAWANQRLTLQGRRYARGMGVCAPSELAYELRPAYRRFVARVGVHQHGSKGRRGSIVAKVVIDDKTVARSKVQRYDDKSFDVDITIPPGAKRIELIITDAGDGKGWDQVAWADAGFITR